MNASKLVCNFLSLTTRIKYILYLEVTIFFSPMVSKRYLRRMSTRSHFLKTKQLTRTFQTPFVVNKTTTKTHCCYFNPKCDFSVNTKTLATVKKRNNTSKLFLLQFNPSNNFNLNNCYYYSTNTMTDKQAKPNTNQQKKAKKEKKSKAERQAAAAAESQRNAPKLAHPEDGDYGDIVLNQSQYRVYNLCCFLCVCVLFFFLFFCDFAILRFQRKIYENSDKNIKHIKIQKKKTKKMKMKMKD